MDFELIEKELITAMLSGQRNLSLIDVEFELLPVLKRDTRERKEQAAKEEAKKLIEILKKP
jgi:hypothetical protein